MRMKHLYGWIAVMATATWLLNLLPTPADADPPIRPASAYETGHTADRPIAAAPIRVSEPRWSMPVTRTPRIPSEPALLTAPEARPLPAHPATADLWRDPIWQSEYQVHRNWGLHPATPQPTGWPISTTMVIDEFVRPVSAEEPIQPTRRDEVEIEVEVVGKYTPAVVGPKATGYCEEKCPLCPSETACLPRYVKTSEKCEGACPQNCVQCPQACSQSCPCPQACAPCPQAYAQHPQACVLYGPPCPPCPQACVQYPLTYVPGPACVHGVPACGNQCPMACQQCPQVCQQCPLACQGHAAACNDVQPDEAAQVILEIMERLGGSRLEGTYFQRADCMDPELARGLSNSGLLSPRQALVQYIRALEASHKHAPKPRHVEAGFIFSNAPAAEPPASPEHLEVLRAVCENLDNVANTLERGNLFQRADQVRGLTSQLRHDARRASGVCPPVHMPEQVHVLPPQEARRHVRVYHGHGVNSDAGLSGDITYSLAPAREPEREIERLREELRKATEKLKQLSDPREE